MPAINADSRTGGDGSSALGFLMAESIAEAEVFYEKLLAKNNRRKEVDALCKRRPLRRHLANITNLDARHIALSCLKAHMVYTASASRVKEAFTFYHYF